MKILKIFVPMSTLKVVELRRVPFVWADSWTKWSYEHKLSIFELDVIFEWIAPEKFQEQGQKLDKNYQNITEMQF